MLEYLMIIEIKTMIITKHIENIFEISSDKQKIRIQNLIYIIF